MEENGILLNDRIKSLATLGESAQTEFKSAKGGFPGSFWESYSAFANTNGGIIVLGVAEKNNKFHFDGLDEATIIKYKKIFWDCAHNRGKISVCLPRESDITIENIGGSYVLICQIPRANYELRPVYVGSNPFGNTYRRNHEGDYLCTDTEVRRMFADAEHDRHSQDARILSRFNFERDIDKESLRQYRQTFATLQPTHPWTSISDMDFMKKIGAYAIDFETGKEGLTLAGLLMFGNYESITNVAADPSYFVDYRERIGTEDSSVRWTNRIYPDGLWEANLYQFYIRVYNRMIQSLPRPFMIKDGVRQEETPAHDAVREALINCIIHSDISAMGNIVVEHTDDKFVFRNPGMMLVSKQQYFKGGRSICRNPILQNIFMRLGGAEKAGSGVDKIVGGWNYLGLPNPTVEEETRPDSVVLTLALKREVKTNTPQDTPQDTKKTLRKEQKIQLLLEFCIEPKSLMEIMKHLGLKDRKSFIEGYINPLLSAGNLVMTEPDKPTSGNQRYVTANKPTD